MDWTDLPKPSAIGTESISRAETSKRQIERPNLWLLKVRNSMKTQGQSRKWGFLAKEKTAGHRQTQDSFLPTHHPSLLPAYSNCVSTETRAECMALLKIPGGPFSSSHQLLSVHSAHFLKAYSPGLGKWGFCCSFRLGAGKPAQGGWQGAPE